jgi:hypothetical protein
VGSREPLPCSGSGGVPSSGHKGRFSGEPSFKNPDLLTYVLFVGFETRDTVLKDDLARLGDSWRFGLAKKLLGVLRRPEAMPVAAVPPGQGRLMVV